MSRRPPNDRRSRGGPEVELSGVSVILDGNEVLRDVSWRVERGENWVVVGPNGAGKTSLLRLLNGYLWPTRGKVTLLGKTFGHVDLRELRRGIGFVSSYMDDWMPEEESVLDVVASGASASTRSWQTPNAKETAYATLLIKRAGCGTLLLRRFGQLSQGERRRIVIARALMARPSLIALDEPCAGLDLSGREDFLSMLSRIAKARTRTMVYVTHRIDEIPSGFTNALLLKDGAVLSQGRLDRVMDERNLSRCFGVKVKVARWRDRYYALVDS